MPLALSEKLILTSLLTENTGWASYKTQTCRMYKGRESDRKTGGIKLSPPLLKS